MTDKNNVIDFNNFKSEIKHLEKEQQRQAEMLNDVSDFVNKRKSEVTDGDFLLYAVNMLLQNENRAVESMELSIKTVNELMGVCEILQEQLTQANEHIGALYEDIVMLEIGTGIYINEVRAEFEIEE